MDSGETILAKAPAPGALDAKAAGALQDEFIQNAKIGQPPIGDSNRVYMCDNGNIGQNMLKDDFNTVNADLKAAMDQWAEKISKANGGASIEVSGSLSSVYESAFCNGIAIVPEQSSAGIAKPNGPIIMPDNAEVSKGLHDLALEFSDKLNGPRLAHTQQDILAELRISAHNDATDKQYQSTIIINPGRN